jgi:hypothetical protein
MRPTRAKSVACDKDLHLGAGIKTNVKIASTKISPPTRGGIWGTLELDNYYMRVKSCHRGYLAHDITHGLTQHDIP